MDIEGLIIGTAIGDAYGAGVEFQDRDWILQNINFTQFVNARDKIQVDIDKRRLFTENYSPWDYTDDTEMTIGVINALLSDQVFSEDLLVAKWKEEYEDGMRRRGFGRNGHGSMRWYYSEEKSIEEIKSFQRNRNNPGNAPAMRAVPLGLIKENLINKYATINAEATHPNINAIISSQCIARAAHFILVRKGDPKEVINYCLDTVEINPEYLEFLQKVNAIPTDRPLLDRDFSILCGEQPIKTPYFLPGIKGMPSDSKFTTGCVLYVLKVSKTPFEALKNSIKFGGDVDSLASVTTGILAGKMGLSSIPKYMLENVEGVEYLKRKAKQLESIICPYPR